VEEAKFEDDSIDIERLLSWTTDGGHIEHVSTLIQYLERGDSEQSADF
jgi:hypothetical protein